MKKRILTAALAGVLACSLSGSALAAGFTDTEGHWAASQISRWNDLGIIFGYGEMFYPNAAITRGDMAVVLDRIMGYQAKAVNPFSDLPENAYYTSVVLGANAAGGAGRRRCDRASQRADHPPGGMCPDRPRARCTDCKRRFRVPRCGGDCRVGASLYSGANGLASGCILSMGISRFCSSGMGSCGCAVPPWCGKEGWSANISAPLGAVCFLERAGENRLRRLYTEETMRKLFLQVAVPENPAYLDAFSQ